MLEILYLDCSGEFVRVNFIAYTLKKMNKQTNHVCAPTYFRLYTVQERGDRPADEEQKQAGLSPVNLQS